MRINKRSCWLLFNVYINIYVQMFLRIHIYIYIVYNFHKFIYIYINNMWHPSSGYTRYQVKLQRKCLLHDFVICSDDSLCIGIFVFWQSWLVGHVCTWYVAYACRCVKTSTARIFCWYQFCCERIGLLHKWLKFAYKSVEWYEAKQSQSLVPNFSVVISKLIFCFFLLVME